MLPLQLHESQQFLIFQESENAVVSGMSNSRPVCDFREQLKPTQPIWSHGTDLADVWFQLALGFVNISLCIHMFFSAVVWEYKQIVFN